MIFIRNPPIKYLIKHPSVDFLFCGSKQDKGKINLKGVFKHRLLKINLRGNNHDVQ